MGPFPHSSPEMQQGPDAGPTPVVLYTKSEVAYRDAGSSNTRCENCAHFSWDGPDRTRGKGSCELVAGAISADFVCDEFEPRGAGGLMDLITGEPTN